MAGKKMDPKVKKLIMMTSLYGTLYTIAMAALCHFLNIRDGVRIIGLMTLMVIVWRIILAVYRRVLLPAKDPTSYGKWVIITDSSEPIGTAFAEDLGGRGMALLLISGNGTGLAKQRKDLSEKYGVPVKCIQYDFSENGEKKQQFYHDFSEILPKLDSDGGIGMLINNAGSRKVKAVSFADCTMEEVDAMVYANVFPPMRMTQLVQKFMVARKKGCVIDISDFSSATPAPYYSVFSATKVFSLQLSRSMHTECWTKGVDFHAITPNGLATRPNPKIVVKGALSQLGKKYIWQSHGSWISGFSDIMLAHWGYGIDVVRSTYKNQWIAAMADKAKES